MTVQDASAGDSATMAAEQVEAVQPEGAGVEELVADKGYHSDQTLVALNEIGVRSYVSEPERGQRCWQDKKTGETPAEKRAAQQVWGTVGVFGEPRGRRLLRILQEVSAAGGTVGFDDESAEVQAQAKNLINRELLRGEIMAGGGVIAYGLTNAGQAALNAGGFDEKVTPKRVPRQRTVSCRQTEIEPRAGRPCTPTGWRVLHSGHAPRPGLAAGRRRRRKDLCEIRMRR